jgi:putative tryptophan/tyrosine transport system substrate-binding protein
MNRREFMVTLAGTAVWSLGPIAARAQQAENVFRVELVFTTPLARKWSGPTQFIRQLRAFVHTLRDLGYIEARNLVLERRTAEGQFERLADIIAELVRLKVDVIVTGGG